jgi:hypothetical protein
MANWLTLSKISQWAENVITGFQYENLSDSDIKQALEHRAVIGRIDTSVDWEDDMYLRYTEAIPDSEKHVHRIAAIVQDILTHKLQSAIELDTFSLNKCCSGIPNGHHRIRALQYLGMDCAPFSLNGDLDALEILVRLAGTECPEDDRQYFSEHLLCGDEFDIVVDLR